MIRLGGEEQLMAKRYWITIRRKGVVCGSVIDRGADRKGGKDYQEEARKRVPGRGGGSRREGSVRRGVVSRQQVGERAAGSSVVYPGQYEGGWRRINEGRRTNLPGREAALIHGALGCIRIF